MSDLLGKWDLRWDTCGRILY